MEKGWPSQRAIDGLVRGLPQQPSSNLRPVEFVTKLDWKTENPEELGKKLQEENNIHPKSNCAVCHR